MDHELVLEYSSSGAINTLQNTIIYFKSGKYMNIRLRHPLVQEPAIEVFTPFSEKGLTT